MSLTFTQINPETENATIYLDRMSSLVLTLTPDADITVQSGSNASTFQIYMPGCFSPNDLNIMTIDKTDWKFSSYSDKNNINDCYLSLTYAGDDNYVWGNGDDFTFTIDRICILQSTKELPYTGSTQITFENFENLSPFTPSYADLTLDNPPPAAGNAHLKEVLQVFLSNEGLIQVSKNTDDPLQNILYLNFKNIGDDSLPMGGGQVKVEFVYGNTSGALTTQEDAWNINAAVANEEGNDWIVNNPDNTSANHPIWTLIPGESGIIGTGADANLIFAFSNIISFTPPGDTQMMVSFSGFMKDENTPYEDTTYVLNIHKLDSPKLRGLTSFYCLQSRYEVFNPTEEIEVDLVWSMYYVNQVKIMTDRSNTEQTVFPSTTTEYSKAISTDQQVFTISGISTSGPITITALAYDGNGDLLNKMECTVFVKSAYIPQIIMTQAPIIEENIDQRIAALQAAFMTNFKGLVQFYADVSTYLISGNSGHVPLTLYWKTYAASQIQIEHDFLPSNELAPIETGSTGFAQGEFPYTTPGIHDCLHLRFTAKAFDGGGQLINSMQHTIFVRVAKAFVDYTNTPYPTIVVGAQLWMAANYSYSHNGMDGVHRPGGSYGKYYNIDAALNNIPEGWRLPSRYEYKKLFSAFSTAEMAPDGASGFNAELGGYYEDDMKNHAHFVDAIGYYWTSDPDLDYEDRYYYCSFDSSGADNNNLAYSIDKNYYLSVRYVKDVE